MRLLRKLSPYRSDIFRICKIEDDAIIRDVFYEATFMRDIFERDRRIRDVDTDNNDTVEHAIFSNDYKVDDNKVNGRDKSFNQKLLAEAILKSMYVKRITNWIHKLP
jgi:hypothetical protein